MTAMMADGEDADNDIGDVDNGDDADGTGADPEGDVDNDDGADGTSADPDGDGADAIPGDTGSTEIIVDNGNGSGYENAIAARIASEMGIISVIKGR